MEEMFNQMLQQIAGRHVPMLSVWTGDFIPAGGGLCKHDHLCALGHAALAHSHQQLLIVFDLQNRVLLSGKEG